MIKVWIMIALLSGDARGYSANGPLVIDNLASKSECERVVGHIKGMYPNGTLAGPIDYRCIEVWRIINK